MRQLKPSVLFAALSNEIRMRCLFLLQEEGELCVCELMHALDMSQPMISRHLALLREDDIVQARKSGQWVYYSLHASLHGWAKNIIVETMNVNKKLLPYKNDLETLQAMVNRPDSACCA